MSYSSSVINKIKNNVNKVNVILNKQGSHGYYLIDETNNDVKLLSKNHDKKEAEKEALGKLNGKEKYIGSHIFYVDVFIDEEYIGKSDILITPVSLTIKEFYLTKSFKLKFKADNKFGAVWYTNDDLYNDAFHFKDIKQLLFNIYYHDLNIVSIGGLKAVDVLAFPVPYKKS